MSLRRITLRRRALMIGVSAVGLALILFLFSVLQLSLTVGEALAQSSSVRPPDNAVTNVRPPEPPPSNAPSQPGVPRPDDAITPFPPTAEHMTSPIGVLGPNSDATLWDEVREGRSFTVSIPDRKAATLVQSYGVSWERMRAQDGPLRTYGGMAFFGILALLFLFYLFRGRIEIEHGRSGVLIERFKPIERFGHWLLAGSFILLALSGLNLLYGRELLIPIIGKETFASVAMAGKWIHNNVAWAFMIALVLVFVMWVVHNLPSVSDIRWVLQGGGLFSEGVHPPAKKFNAGQKLIFWAVILLGGSVSLSGLSLLFPYEMPLFAKTFAILNDLGVEAIWGAPLATNLTPLEEMQYAQIWHTIVALAMIVIIIAHIYIGSMGMEGAFDAMGSGMVDLNWAEEHHGLWVDKLDVRKASGGSAATPAE